jgi:putative ATP-binding cassette transporter
MELDHHTEFLDGGFTNTDLSTGQRKRLAFIAAIIQERPILILDELAADQDAAFRKRFYQEIIPKLKAEGKTIIAVTHDDMYFDAADHLFKMDAGKLSRYVQ